MSSNSQTSRTIIAIVGSLLMSALAVGAAVGPATANGGAIKVSLNA